MIIPHMFRHINCPEPRLLGLFFFPHDQILVEKRGSFHPLGLNVLPYNVRRRRRNAYYLSCNVKEGSNTIIYMNILNKHYRKKGRRETEEKGRGK